MLYFIACLEIITGLIHNISIFHVEIYMKFNDIFKISDCGLLTKTIKMNIFAPNVWIKLY